ncbi:hypothetical protein PBI_ARCHERS7_152 [Mycobacterium phage ArcherS7]|uniref:Uncharacterized protein n=7 Tax=Bixzunavirus Bxz1 TaxID=2006134 RepID=G1BT47_9CAUD|nr:hypothetical protein M180_gp172 [Mycobacterium phage ArcherS7]YP_009221279.1 hypothetical protein AWH68_gp171 [Mycobacterium phage Breeniome]AEK06941.1 hypothetical protein DRAZDYS_151 [Mycobacterium phage Drazdys]AER49667.1 hypothetical protein PIO_158 [Mycobacterium phage Pio]ALF51013.1 hypothetical protein SEA_DTDEVON_154 [Mycobacterium phage DTDevon]ANT41684.1 hypothetical protein PBI_LITTLETON_153 [Mycobacterium phage Littleton]AOZ63271.1 hypothetical protein SEA_ERDMANN_153 [Mycobact
MIDPSDIWVGRYVRLAPRGRGRVYEVVEVRVLPDGQWFRVAATARHRQAAKRVPDALRWYAADELFPMGKARAPR